MLRAVERYEVSGAEILVCDLQGVFEHDGVGVDEETGERVSFLLLRVFDGLHPDCFLVSNVYGLGGVSSCSRMSQLPGTRFFSYKGLHSTDGTLHASHMPPFFLCLPRACAAAAARRCTGRPSA